MLLATLVVAVWLGWHCDLARRQKRSVAAITRLGGWVYYNYELVDGKFDPQAESWVPASLRSLLGDDFFHGVAEVNLVYHSEGGKRLDNDQMSDEALYHLDGFPRLRRLLLHGRQATDEGLAHVGRLKHLDTLLMWDASEVSDAGIAHLSGLKKLKCIHCDHSQITDESLRILAGLPRIEELSLQGNRFTDKGRAYLEGKTQLQQLVLGLGETDITDDGIRHLRGLVNLERLGLQRTHITSKGLEHLKGLNNLKDIWLHGSRVTDTGSLQDALPNCRIGK
jgi:hypothetical protein